MKSTFTVLVVFPIHYGRSSNVILACDNIGTLSQEPPTQCVLVLYSPSTRCNEKIVACHSYLPFTYLLTIKTCCSLFLLHLLTDLTWTAIVNSLRNEVFVCICGIAILARNTCHWNVRMLRARRLLLIHASESNNKHRCAIVQPVWRVRLRCLFWRTWAQQPCI
jgi:hypothetical protein